MLSDKLYSNWSWPSCQSARGRQQNKFIGDTHWDVLHVVCSPLTILDIFMNGNWFWFKLKLIVCRCVGDSARFNVLACLHNRWASFKWYWAFNGRSCPSLQLHRIASLSLHPKKASIYCGMSRSFPYKHQIAPQRMSSTRKQWKDSDESFQWHRRSWWINQNQNWNFLCLCVVWLRVHSPM